MPEMALIMSCKGNFSWKKKPNNPKGCVTAMDQLPEHFTAFFVRLQGDDYWTETFKVIILGKKENLHKYKFAPEIWLPSAHRALFFASDFMFLNYWDAYRYFNLIVGEGK